MAKKGKLGALNQIKKGIASVSDEAYADPASKHLGDWAWKPLKEVTAKLEVTEVPDYVQKGYGDFMKMQAARAAAGNLNKRDLAKAFGITQSSIGRGGLPHASATKAGLKVPNTGELVRPEGAFAEWLGSKMGQRYLKAAERGEIDPEAIADIQAKFSPFGKPNQLAEQLAYGATDLVQRPEDISKIVGGDKEAFRDFAQSIKGINQAKAGFIGSLLGRGDLPTLDARQLKTHTLPPEGVKVESVMKRGKYAGAREAVDRLIARQEAMGLDLDPSLDPFYQHLTHHTAWDKASNSKTTHDDLVRAMRGYSGGGLAHLAKGGGKLGAVKRMGRAISDVSNEADQMMPAAGGLRFADAPRGGPSIIKEEGGNWRAGRNSIANHLKPMRKVDAPRYTHINEQGQAVGPGFGRPMTKEELQREMDDPILVKNKALNNWIDRNLTNYMKNQMGTKSDPVRKLADQGITHFADLNDLRMGDFLDPDDMGMIASANKRMREKIGMPANPIAETQMGRNWEEHVDDIVGESTYKAHEYATPDVIKNNPWMANLPEGTPFYGVPESGLTDSFNFKHITDVLNEDLQRNRIRPEQLNKISMEQAVRRVHAYDQQKAKEMAEAQIKVTEGMPVHKEYPEGYKWIELTKPKYEVLEENLPAGYTLRKSDAPYEHQKWQVVDEKGLPAAEYVKANFNYSIPDPKLKALENFFDKKGNERLKDALDYEGKTMGHCVGGYCPDVISGKKRIYSLRDAKGEPHVTVEVAPPKASIHGGADDVAYARITDEADRMFGAEAEGTQEYMSFVNNKLDLLHQDQPSSIVQIKGKGNRRPLEKYDPYTQDFVQSGKWSGVGDVDNTGLLSIERAFPKYEDQKYFANAHPSKTYLNKDEAKAFHDRMAQEVLDEFANHRIKPDPGSKTTLGRTDLMRVRELAELEFPGDLQRQANMIRGALQGTNEPGAYMGSIHPPEGMRDGGAVNSGQYDYNDGGAAFGVYPKAGMEPKPKSDEHLKRMVAIAKEHLAETNRKIRKNGVGDMIRHSLIAPAIGGASDILNLPLELVDYMQSQVPALSEPESVLAMYDRKQTSPHAQTEWDSKAKYPVASDKPFMGTADVRERMAKYGVTTGEEYPFYDQFGEFVVDPFIGYKVLKAGYKGAKKARGALQTIKP